MLKRCVTSDVPCRLTSINVKIDLANGILVEVQCAEQICHSKSATSYSTRIQATLTFLGINIDEVAGFLRGGLGCALPLGGAAALLDGGI